MVAKITIASHFIFGNIRYKNAFLVTYHNNKNKKNYRYENQITAIVSSRERSCESCLFFFNLIFSAWTCPSILNFNSH